MDNNRVECILEDNKGLIFDIIKKNFPTIYHTYDFEDYVQEGYIALYNAAKYFDESRGNKFSTVATTFIRNRLITYSQKRENKLKQYDTNKNVLSMNKEIGLTKYRENGACNTLSDILVDKKVDIENSYINTDSRKRIVKKLNTMLPKKSKEVFQYILQGKSRKEMSQILGCTGQNIDCCIKKIKECAELVIKEAA